MVARAHAYFAEVFRWSADASFRWPRVCVAVAAMVVPVLACTWLGHPALGYVIGLGAMLLGGEQGEQPSDSHGWLWSFLPIALAISLALVVSRLPFAALAMLVAVGAAATLVNYSRPAAVAGIRFAIFLVLNLGIIGSHGVHGRGAALMFGMGAAWRLLLRIVARFAPATAEDDKAPSASPARQPTARQRRIHYGRMLRSLQGWQYPLRLVAGLGAAIATRNLWPAHHLDWMVLSVVLLTPRALEHLPVHITQRAVGTTAGVAFAGGILLVAPGHAVVLILACVLGTAASLVRAGNYAAYCFFATPLILLAVDGGGALHAGLLWDRLLATLAATAIVVAANVGMDLLLRARTEKAS